MENLSGKRRKTWKTFSLFKFHQRISFIKVRQENHEKTGRKILKEIFEKNVLCNQIIYGFSYVSEPTHGLAYGLRRGKWEKIFSEFSLIFNPFLQLLQGVSNYKSHGSLKVLQHYFPGWSVRGAGEMIKIPHIHTQLIECLRGDRKVYGNLYSCGHLKSFFLS